MPKRKQGELLTQKEKRFCEEYLKDLNGAQAAIRAGYAKDSANVTACQNLIKPNIAARIGELIEERSRRTQIEADKALWHLAGMAFYIPKDFMRIGENGDPFLDLSNLTREQSLAIKSFEVEDYKDGRGEEARDVRKVKVHFNDKLSAVDKVMRHLGLYPEKGGKQQQQAVVVLDPNDPAWQAHINDNLSAFEKWRQQKQLVDRSSKAKVVSKA